MVVVHPFKGLRPKPEYASRVASPPYDVLSSDEARRLAAGDPLTYLHVEKPEIDLDPAIDLYDARVYAKGVENFQKYINDGVFVQDAKPKLYFYRLTWRGQSQLGLVACCAADDYDQGRILKHEFTRKDKEEDRTRYTYELNANMGPVFFLYKAQAALNDLAARATAAPAVYDFQSADGVRNEFWVVDDDALIAAIVAEFTKLPVVYVADGHHRTASGANVRAWKQKENPRHTGNEEYNFFMAVLFPHDQLRILDYNRVVKDLNGLTPIAFLKRVGEKFDVDPYVGAGVYRPEQTHAFGLYLDGRWYRLFARQGTYDAGDAVARLDAAILQANLLTPILGIDDPRTSKRIDFVGGIRGLEELERRCREDGFACALALFPVTVAELMAVADAGQIMPPKSTWFEPKLKSGLVAHLLSE